MGTATLTHGLLSGFDPRLLAGLVVITTFAGGVTCLAGQSRPLPVTLPASPRLPTSLGCGRDADCLRI